MMATSASIPSPAPPVSSISFSDYTIELDSNTSGDHMIIHVDASNLLIPQSAEPAKSGQGKQQPEGKQSAVSRLFRSKSKTSPTSASSSSTTSSFPQQLLVALVVENHLWSCTNVQSVSTKDNTLSFYHPLTLPLNRSRLLPTHLLHFILISPPAPTNEKSTVLSHRHIIATTSITLQRLQSIAAANGEVSLQLSKPAVTKGKPTSNVEINNLAILTVKPSIVRKSLPSSGIDEKSIGSLNGDIPNDTTIVALNEQVFDLSSFQHKQDASDSGYTLSLGAENLIKMSPIINNNTIAAIYKRRVGPNQTQSGAASRTAPDSGEWELVDVSDVRVNTQSPKFAKPLFVAATYDDASTHYKVNLYNVPTIDSTTGTTVSSVRVSDNDLVGALIMTGTVLYHALKSPSEQGLRLALGHPSPMLHKRCELKQSTLYVAVSGNVTSTAQAEQKASEQADAPLSQPAVQEGESLPAAVEESKHDEAKIDHQDIQPQPLPPGSGETGTVASAPSTSTGSESEVASASLLPSSVVDTSVNVDQPGEAAIAKPTTAPATESIFGDISAAAPADPLQSHINGVTSTEPTTVHEKQKINDEVDAAATAARLAPIPTTAEKVVESNVSTSEEKPTLKQAEPEAAPTTPSVSATPAPSEAAPSGNVSRRSSLNTHEEIQQHLQEQAALEKEWQTRPLRSVPSVTESEKAMISAQMWRTAFDDSINSISVKQKMGKGSASKTATASEQNVNVNVSNPDDLHLLVEADGLRQLAAFAPICVVYDISNQSASKSAAEVDLNNTGEELVYIDNTEPAQDTDGSGNPKFNTTLIIPISSSSSPPKRLLFRLYNTHNHNVPSSTPAGSRRSSGQGLPSGKPARSTLTEDNLIGTAETGVDQIKSAAKETILPLRNPLNRTFDRLLQKKNSVLFVRAVKPNEEQPQ